MINTMTAPTTVLVGHPFAPIGRGEDVRCTYRALRSVAVRPGLLDIFAACQPHPDDAREFSPALVDGPGRINVMHLNGDEIGNATTRLGGLPQDAFNIVYPAWELARYPLEWARALDRFDEIWAPSTFIRDALKGVVERPVLDMPLASEVMLTSLLNRRVFNIPESAYAFLFFFDFRSYRTRKNPDAVVAAFRRLREARPYADTCLVIKVSGAHHATDDLRALKDAVADLGKRALIIDRKMSDNEVKNLVRCCDCFVSLHRAEGFGRGLAEAMYLSKPVIATAYSGNMDFMDRGSAMLVDYELVPVGAGEYPYPEGQVWANADVEQAAAHMAALVDDPEAGRRLGHRASLKVRDLIGYRAAGLRYRKRLTEIAR